MIEIEITNYESIKHAHIKVDGFTVITGRNHLGKSAVLRAINAALTNEQGTSFINWEAKYAEVRIRANNLDLTWHKEDGNNFYVVNGKRLEKVGNEPPPSAITEAGLGLITAGNDKINLHYSEQFFPLFLVDKRDSKTADLLISIYGLDRLYKSSDLCAKDIRKNRSLLKTRQADLESAQREIARFEGFEEVLKAKAQIVGFRNQVKQAESEIIKFKDLRDSYSKLAQEYKKLKAVESVEVQDYSPITDFQESINNLKELNLKLTGLAKEIKRLESISSVSIIDREKLEIEQREIEKLKALQIRYEKLYTEEQNLSKSDKVKIPAIKFGCEITNLKSLQEKLIKSARETKEIEIELSEVKKQIDGITDQLSAFDKCPACGADIK